MALFDSDDSSLSSCSQRSDQGVFAEESDADDDATAFTVSTVLETRGSRERKSKRKRRDTITRTMPTISIDRRKVRRPSRPPCVPRCMSPHSIVRVAPAWDLGAGLARGVALARRIKRDMQRPSALCVPFACGTRTCAAGRRGGCERRTATWCSTSAARRLR